MRFMNPKSQGAGVTRDSNYRRMHRIRAIKRRTSLISSIYPSMTPTHLGHFNKSHIYPFCFSRGSASRGQYRANSLSPRVYKDMDPSTNTRQILSRDLMNQINDYYSDQ